MLDKCPMPWRRNSFMKSFLILLCLLFSLVSKSALQIESSILDMFFHPQLVKGGFLSSSRENDFTWPFLLLISPYLMDIVAAEWLFHEFTSQWVQAIAFIMAAIPAFFFFFSPVDGWLLCHCIPAFASSVFCEFVYWLLDNFSCFHSAVSYIVNAVKAGILVLWMELRERRRDLIAEYKSSEFLNA